MATAATALVAKTAAAVTRKAVASARFIRDGGNRRAGPRPSMSTGFLPRTAVIGAVRIDVNRPSAGGRRMKLRHGKAIGEGNQGGDRAARAISR